MHGDAHKLIQELLILEYREQFFSFNYCDSEIINVMVYDKLTWKNHIGLVKLKLSKSCAATYRANFSIDRSGMHILLYSLFSPYIMYCAEVWGNTYATNV